MKLLTIVSIVVQTILLAVTQDTPQKQATGSSYLFWDQWTQYLFDERHMNVTFSRQCITHKKTAANHSQLCTYVIYIYIYIYIYMCVCVCDFI